MSVWRRGPWGFGLWLVLLALGLAWIARTPFQADLSAFLPRDPDVQQQVLMAQIQSGLPARTLLIGLEGGTALGRAEASRALAAALRQSDLFEQVQNGELAAWRPVGEWLLEHRYQLSPGVGPDRFTSTGLRSAMDETLSLLGTPAGSAFKPLLDRDPTGEMQRIGEMLIPSQAPRTEQGVWMSRTHPRALMLVSTRAGGGDLDGQALAIEKVRTAFHALPNAQQDPSQRLTLQLSGAPLFAVNSRAQIEQEVKVFAIAGTVLMGVLLAMALGSVRAVLVAFVPVATGVVCGIAAVSLVFGHVHGITLGFGSTLIGESVDYAIYFLIQARQGAGAAPGSGWRHWIRDGWPTVRLGLWTSVCGFAALVFSGFPGLAQLGVFSLAGLVAAALTTRHVLPLFMPDGAPGQGARQFLASVARMMSHHLPRWRWVWAGMTVAVAAALWWQTSVTPQGLWRGDLKSLSPISAADQALDAELRADLGASDGGVLVVVQAADDEAVLQATETVTDRLQSWLEDGRLKGFESPTRWLPSQATQAMRLQSLPESDPLRRALAEATRGGPLPVERLEPFLADVARARANAPITQASVQGTPIAPLVNAMLWHREDGGVSALLPLQLGNVSVSLLAWREALSEGLGQGVQVHVLSIQSALDGLYNGYLRQALWQVSLGALGVLGLMAFWLRSPGRLLRVGTPLVGAVVLTLGGLWWGQVSLGVLHLVGLLLVVAVGSNYVLFFDALAQASRGHSSPGGVAPVSGRHDLTTQSTSAFSQDRLNDDTLASLLLANLTTVLSFGLIAFSSIPVLSAFGMVVAPGAFLAFVLAASWIPVSPSASDKSLS